MTAALDRKDRRWLVPEVVQISSMDCGPASLKCLLEGFRVPVSYGRLREACQTDVDGTSINTLEDVANDLGLEAEQAMLPPEYLLLETARVLPALVVMRQADGSTHFVVIWRRSGRWLQIMDPSVGRRWVTERQLLDELFHHELSVPAADWRAWVDSDAFLGPLRERLAALGMEGTGAQSLIGEMLAGEEWFPIAAFDAAVRFAGTVVRAGGLSRGIDAARLLESLWRETIANPHDIHALIPDHYWSALPDPRSLDHGERRVLLRGAVLMRVTGCTPVSGEEADERLSPELRAALDEKVPPPLETLRRLLLADGLLGPSVLVGAIGIALLATLLEALLMRGLLDIGSFLAVGTQRLIAALALLAFMMIMLAVRFPIAAESIRFGRRLETRLRMALLRKLPRLTDRYFQSRPISDMAERSHSLHLIRGVPATGIQVLQTFGELVLTIIGIALIDPASAPLAFVVATISIVLPALFQPLINETDLRMRSHAGALHGFHLDSLLGIVPIRVHRAQGAVRRLHESLLVEWARALRRLVATSLTADAVQQTLCLALTAVMLLQHFARFEDVTGGDLLLVYWALKLPAAGAALAGLAHQYPAQRNVLLRLLEPLDAPEEAGSPAVPVTSRGSGPVEIVIRAGTVVAGGHEILREVDLTVAPGEHVAVVGPSGAGKSSLLGLLLGWHRLADGTLTVDGEELDSDRLEALRVVTAWVDPAIQLWNRSFLENMSYSAPTSELGRIAPAVDAAHLRGLLNRLDAGLQTSLGEGGCRLSGGEGQRVRFGRALVQGNVRLALLDEPFRGLDRGQRLTLMQEARRQWSGVTMLCVTHDIGETLEFDRVLVVEDGTIVENGTPAALRSSDSRYRDLLRAEDAARSRLWAGTQWRGLRVEGGSVA